MTTERLPSAAIFYLYLVGDGGVHSHACTYVLRSWNNTCFAQVIFRPFSVISFGLSINTGDGKFMGLGTSSNLFTEDDGVAYLETDLLYSYHQLRTILNR